MREDPADNISKMISTTWLIRMTMRRPFFAASILQKRMELNEITKERNHQIHIDGWGDLLNSILLHEKEYEEGLKLTTLDQITTSTVTVTETKYPNHQAILITVPLSHYIWQLTLLEMEHEMKEKEEEFRQLLLAEQNERAMRKERIQREILRVREQNVAAVSQSIVPLKSFDSLS
jgi:hypothetical protein